MTDQTTTSGKPKTLIWVLYLLAIFIVGMGALIMTDVGQIFRINKEMVVFYFKFSNLLFIISFILLAVAVYLSVKHKALKRWLLIGLPVVWLGLLLSSKFATPYVMFVSQQHTSEFISIQKADNYLDPTDIVYVVDYNGEAKAYPRKMIWQPHIIGGDYNGEDVVFTYCVLTNLPAPYLNDLNGEEMNLRVLAQTNNNLLLWDTESDEIIQQIEHRTEFGETQLEPIPVMEMPWSSFPKLFPKGEVFFNEFTTPVEKIVEFLAPPDNVTEKEEWMFKTANFDDKRLIPKEQIMGVVDGEKSVAITKGFLKQQGVYNLDLGNTKIVLAYHPEYEMITAFNRVVDGKELEIESVDPYGNSDQGKLERAYIFNSVLWAVWAHYYPQTEVIQ